MTSGGACEAHGSMVVFYLSLCLVLSFSLPLDDSETASVKLDKFIKHRVASNHIPSLSALVQHNGTILWNKAYGYSNPFSTPPLKASTTMTAYTMASVSKTVMATTLMLLFDKGLFALDDDINMYLSKYPKAGFEVRNPGYPNSAITFRQLLTHTSSVSDHSYYKMPDNVTYTRGRDSPLSLRDLLHSYFSPKGQYYSSSGCFHQGAAPGEKYDYSNMGATLLGYMVEVLTGIDFARYSMANVVQPLGMKADTNNWLLDPPLNPTTVALPSSWKKHKGRLEPYCTYGTADYPDGGFRATAMGLALHQACFMQFGRLSNGTQLLKEDTVHEMRRKQTLPGLANQAQGLIWFYERQDGRDLLGHDGSDFGVSTQYFFNPKTNVGVVILMNGDWDQMPHYSDAVDEINNKLFDIFEAQLGLEGKVFSSESEEHSRYLMSHNRHRRKRRHPSGAKDLCNFASESDTVFV